MKKDVSKTKNGVKINFLGEVKKEQIVTIVQNCSTGKCECMSDETKSKVKDMQVSGKDGDIRLDLKGNISVKEIEEALLRSKVINS